MRVHSTAHQPHTPRNLGQNAQLWATVLHGNKESRRIGERHKQSAFQLHRLIFWFYSKKGQFSTTVVSMYSICHSIYKVVFLNIFFNTKKKGKPLRLVISSCSRWEDLGRKIQRWDRRRIDMKTGPKTSPWSVMWPGGWLHLDSVFAPSCVRLDFWSARPSVPGWSGFWKWMKCLSDRLRLRNDK